MKQAKPIMHLTLRHKINAAIIITFLLVAVVFSAIQFPFQRHRMQMIVNRIEVLLQTLIERDLDQLANEIFDSRINALGIRLKQMQKVKGVLALAVFDKSGKMIISQGAPFIFQDMELKVINKIHHHSQVQKIKWHGHAGLLFTRKINFLGEDLGFIRIYYSLKNVEQAQRLSFLIFSSLLGSIFLIMLIVLNLMLSKVILQPIRYLMDAATLIASGNLEQDINLPSKDELGNLGKSFENMRDAIKEKISDFQRLTIILESTSDLVAISAPDKKVIYMNRAGLKMVGWNENESLKGKSIGDIYPEWAARKADNISTPEAVAYNTWEGESELIGSDGKKILVSQVVMSHKNSKGELEFLSTIMRDITAQKQAEHKLRHLQTYLSNVFDSMPSVLVGVDVDGNITQWNTQAVHATGTSAKDAVGQPLEQLFTALSDEMERIYKAIRTGEIQFDPKKVTLKNGEIRYENITVYPLISNGVEGAVIRVDDITEQIRLEEMMIQSEKMLSVGGLAAGMAHEINNPLAGIMQTADVMKGRLTDIEMPANKRIAEEVNISMDGIRAFMEKRGILRMAETIHDSGQRVAQIVDNMLSFARKGDAIVSSHNPVELLDKILELAATDFDLKKHYDFKTIKITKEYEKDIPMVPCERAKIQQVLLNVLRNGAQAMHEYKNGKNEYTPEFILRLYCETRTNMLVIEIEDNGPGMDEKTSKRVFEPFFTTKPVGVGTGLGLSVSYFIIVENHKGEMRVESAAGSGSKFIISLPLEF